MTLYRLCPHTSTMDCYLEHMYLKTSTREFHTLLTDHHVILFDGVCNFCNTSVDFVIARDPYRQFKFGTLQSEIGQAILTDSDLPTQDFTTFLYIEHGTVFIQSTAALKVARCLIGLWPLLYGLMIVPRPIRDAVYRSLARRRYLLMGKRDVCRFPTERDRHRFLSP